MSTVVDKTVNNPVLGLYIIMSTVVDVPNLLFKNLSLKALCEADQIQLITNRLGFQRSATISTPHYYI